MHCCCQLLLHQQHAPTELPHASFLYTLLVSRHMALVSTRVQTDQYTCCLQPQHHMVLVWLHGQASMPTQKVPYRLTSTAVTSATHVTSATPSLRMRHDWRSPGVHSHLSKCCFAGLCCRDTRSNPSGLAIKGCISLLPSSCWGPAESSC